MSDKTSGSHSPKTDRFAAARQKMIEDQLQQRGIKNPLVLEAIWRIPRHLFVSPEHLERSYEDSALPSQEGQTISQPFMVARMTQELDVRPDQQVLEIGTGTGYQTAILADIVGNNGRVYTIERSAILGESAQRLLESMDITNVRYQIGDGSAGWLGEQVEFDRILVTAGTPVIPKPLIAQLKIGGIMVVPVGGEERQMLYRVLRHPDRVEEISLFDCRFVPLVGEHGWPQKI